VKIWQNWNNQTLHCHLAEVRGVCFSTDGQLAASASDDKTIKVWDATTSACLHTIRCGDTGVYSVALSPDGLFIATALRNCTVKIWNVRTHQLAHEMEGHSSVVKHIQLSPDGRQIVSVSGESMRVWDRDTGAMLAVVASIFSSLERIRFDEDGTIVLQLNGSVKRWKLSPGSTCEPTSIGDHTDRPDLVTDLSKESSSAIPDTIPVPIPGAPFSSDVASEPVSTPLVLVPLSEEGRSDAISLFSHSEQKVTITNKMDEFRIS